MDKSKYKMTGIHLGSTGYGNMLLKFMGYVDAEQIISILSDADFNEFDWMQNLSEMLKKSGITYLMCEAEKLDSDPAIFSERGLRDEENYMARLETMYDIYIEVLEVKGEDEETTQYVYVYSEEWEEGKRIEHTAGIDEHSGRFWDETYVSSVKKCPDAEFPKYSMDAKISGQDSKRCVPYYDRYVILKNIRDIYDCNDLRDYAEEETKERMKE